MHNIPERFVTPWECFKSFKWQLYYQVNSDLVSKILNQKSPKIHHSKIWLWPSHGWRMPQTVLTQPDIAGIFTFCLWTIKHSFLFNIEMSLHRSSPRHAVTWCNALNTFQKVVNLAFFFFLPDFFLKSSNCELEIVTS